MVIMALDHTRDYFHIDAMTGDPLNPDTTTGILFFTRWITHFCAPTFVFLSGLSAYLSAQKKTSAQASKFLLKRGLWLVVVEIVIITFGLTFNPLYNFIILQVIWAIGCSMILLAFFSRISYKLVLIIGILLVFGHNIFNLFPAPKDETAGSIIKILFTAFGTVIPIGNNHFIGVFYAILPWTGIMFLGYAAGKWFTNDYDPITRHKNLKNYGALALIIFVALRLLSVYGDPVPRKEYHDLFKNILSFFNVSKYPPSLEYTSLTLGFALTFLVIAESIKNKVFKVFSVYGSVPFFYYTIHFYLLHSILILLFFLEGNTTKQIIQIPFLFRPVKFGYDLWIVYCIWLVVVISLYYPCKWFKKYKATHKNWWLNYI
ncbi:membrane protein [Pedobacter mendelii]|uniref:Membrane protein n=2 Tax=Pedobacter mendelii TaxID=1908240 RepID=A0ABQ2BGP2_9SPHI|nr:membrane protein [Pedobacter mendelii]